MDFFHPGQLQQVLALVATLLLSGALAAAPGDESSTCQWSDPETQRVLMDSNRYSNLIKTRETVRVWREFDVDGGGPGNSWVYSTGGQCARQVESCSYFAGTQNNWLFTQHILKRIPASNYQTRIYVDVSYSGLICSSTVDAKVFYKIENTASDQTTNDRYLQYTSQLMGLPCGGSSPVLSSFVLSEGQDGFYIAIQDPGACVTIRRLVVYRKRCPSRQVGLVLYPEAPAPLTDVSVEANCVSNAAGTGLTLTCNSEGVWSGTPQCECNPGYRREGDNCTACQPGTFRSPTDSPSSCINCPANTITTEPHTGMCQCMEGFFRTAEERANDGCSSPPSQVQNLRISTADATSITLTWDRPETPGRSDLHYAVDISDPNQLGVFLPFRVFSDSSSTVVLRIMGLTPNTTYIFKVSTRNGVSRFDATNDDLRVEEVSGTTLASLPQPLITSPGVVGGVRVFDETVVWSRPTNTGREITRYELRFHTSGQLNTVPSRTVLDPNQQWFRPTHTQLPSGGPIYVQIRAVNSAGNGPWSGQNTQYIPQPLITLPGVVGDVRVFDDTVVWSRPTNTGGEITRYELRFHTSGQLNTVPSRIVSNPNQQWFRPTQSQIPSGGPVYVQIRAVNSVGTGLWSGQNTQYPHAPGPPEVQIYDRVIVWQEPNNPNGIITGYCVRFIRDSIKRLVPEIKEHYHVIRDEDIPSGNGQLKIQVRAKNAAGNGTWSPEINVTDSCQDEVEPTVKPSEPPLPEYPPCTYDTCARRTHKICIVNATGCGDGTLPQYSSCRVCTAGEKFTDTTCSDRRCPQESNIDSDCIRNWGKCVKNAPENRNRFVRPSASSELKCVEHICRP